MSGSFDWDKFLTRLAEDHVRRRRAASSSTDPWLAEAMKEMAADERKRERAREERRQEYEHRRGELEATLLRLERIEDDLKKCGSEGSPDSAKTAGLLSEKMLLHFKVLGHNVIYPEAKAEAHYSALKTMNVLGPADPDAAAGLSSEIESAYARFFLNQLRLYDVMHQEKSERPSGHGSKKADEASAKVQHLGPIALEKFKKLGDSGKTTVKVGAGYEVYNEAIVLSRSADETSATVRVSSNAFFLFEILEIMLKHSSGETARQYEKELNDLDIGYRKALPAPPKPMPVDCPNNARTGSLHQDETRLLLWLLAIGLLIAFAAVIIGLREGRQNSRPVSGVEER